MPEDQVSAKQLRAMLRAQDYEKALPVLDALIHTNPDDAPAHWHRASCMEAFGRLDDALDEVKHVLRINPDYAPALIKQTELETNLRKTVAAAPISVEALAQFSNDDPLDAKASQIALLIYQVGNEAEPSYAECRMEDYPKYQQTYAARALDTMTKAGFEWVGDYDPLHLKQVLEAPSLIRIYSGDQGTCFAASYCLASQWPGWIGFLRLLRNGQWKKSATIELETAISDGQFIITNNSDGTFTFGGTVATEQLPSTTKIEDVIKRHRARVNEYLRINHKERALSATTMDEILPLLRKLTAAKNLYRKSIGYINDAELRRLLDTHYDLLADRVRARLVVLGKPH